jgi:hypothetical protein
MNKLNFGFITIYGLFSRTYSSKTLGSDWFAGV